MHSTLMTAAKTMNILILQAQVYAILKLSIWKITAEKASR